MVSVEDLYRHYGVLADAKDNARDHEASYRAILSGVKGGISEKRLSSQFIIRFFKHFPHLTVDVINAMFDLCEDHEVTIRKQAIKDLTQLCREIPEQVSKIAEALTMLMACEDVTELNLVHASLVSILKFNHKEALKGIFGPLTSEGEERDPEIIEQTLKFLLMKLKHFQDEWLDNDCENFLMDQFKKMLAEASKEEFLLIVDLMKKFKVMASVTGRQQLIDIIVAQAELDQPFKATDGADVDRLIQCVRQSSSLFSKNVHSKPFVVYMCRNVIPHISDISGDDTTGAQLDILKLFADIVDNVGELPDTDNNLQCIFDKLLDYMPEPPESAASEETPNDEPKLNFSHVECLLYAFHVLVKKYPQFITDEKYVEQTKNFKQRLHFFARGVQTYIKQLKLALQDKSASDLKSDENKIKIMALKITSNINVLVKDMMHTPPSLKAVITPSWKTAQEQKTTATPPKAGEKRADTDISNGAPLHTKKPSQLIYTPPRRSFTSYNRGNQGRFRGGRGRGWRYRSY